MLDDMKKPAAARAEPTEEMFALYDAYAHGMMDRRSFLEGMGKAAATAGISMAAALAWLTPDYSEAAQQVTSSDPRVRQGRVTYPSPNGAGEMGGLLVHPAEGAGPWPGVLVIHENRGLNPHIEDVARRAAVAGYLALAPDALHPLGGYPGNDDDGRALQRKRDRAEMFEDFVAGAAWLKTREDCTGRTGCMGFCYGGGVANGLAARDDAGLNAAVPFYGRALPPERAGDVGAELLIHLAGEDARVNADYPAYLAALREADKAHVVHTYEGARHGFHNDTTARFDANAAALAWERTIAFLDGRLKV